MPLPLPLPLDLDGAPREVSEGVFWPKVAPRGPQSAQDCLQERPPRGLQEAPKRPPRGPKRLPRWPKTAPRAKRRESKKQ